MVRFIGFLSVLLLLNACQSEDVSSTAPPTNSTSKRPSPTPTNNSQNNANNNNNGSGSAGGTGGSTVIKDQVARAAAIESQFLADVADLNSSCTNDSECEIVDPNFKRCDQQDDWVAILKSKRSNYDTAINSAKTAMTALYQNVEAPACPAVAAYACKSELPNFMSGSNPLLILQSSGCSAVCDLGKCRPRGKAALKREADPYKVNVGEINLEGRIPDGLNYIDYSLKFSRKLSESTYKFEYEFYGKAGSSWTICRGNKTLSATESSDLSERLKSNIEFCERSPRTAGSLQTNPRRVTIRTRDASLGQSASAYHSAPNFPSGNLSDIYACNGVLSLLQFADAQEDSVPGSQRVGTCPDRYADVFTQ